LWVMPHHALSYPMYPLEHVEHARLGVFYVFSAPPPIHSRPSPSPLPLPPYVPPRTHPSGCVRCVQHHPLTPQPHPICQTRQQAHLGLLSCLVPLPPYVPPQHIEHARLGVFDVFSTSPTHLLTPQPHPTCLFHLTSPLKHVSASPTHPLTPNTSNTSVWACLTCSVSPPPFPSCRTPKTHTHRVCFRCSTPFPSHRTHKTRPLGVLCVQRSSHSPPAHPSPGTPKTHLDRCVLGVRLLFLPLCHSQPLPFFSPLPVPSPSLSFLAIYFLVIHLYYNICILLLLN